MKYLHKLLLAFSLIFSFAQSSEQQLTPHNTFFAFDIDEVLVEASRFQKPQLVLGGMWQDPLNSHNWLASLMNIKDVYKRDENGKRECLLDQQGNEINGLAFHFLYHGMNDTNIAPYVSWIIDILEASRVPIQGTIEICRYLKHKKGYTIVFATNKDRASYDVFAKHMGIPFTSLAERVFVAHPGNDELFLDAIKTFIIQRHVSQSYKAFAQIALTVEPTQWIRHVPTLKPNPAYYQYVHETIQEEFDKEHMIFIDDKQKNINGVSSYNQQTDAHIIGITFINPYLLAKRLVELGILSKEKDTPFLCKMEQYK